MSAARLVRLLPPLTEGEWPLDPERSPWRVGRSRGGSGGPHVDLWPDLGVSQRHAAIRWADGGYWIADAGSKRGTRVDGAALERGRPRRIDPGATIDLGHSRLLLAAPGAAVLRRRGWVVEIEPPAVLGYVVARHRPSCGRVVLHNCREAESEPAALELSFGAYAAATIAVPSVPALGRHAAPPIEWSFDENAMAGLRERRWMPLRAQLDGEGLEPAAAGAWLLPANEQSFLPEHRVGLAAFVQPSHPLVVRLQAEALADEPVGGDPVAPMRALYEHLHSAWRIGYRHEPPQYAAAAQRVRLPHDVLADPIARSGQGTCLDLALLVAAALEAHGGQPLVAVLDLSGTHHALVGCWRRPGPRLDPLRDDPAPLLAEALWIDVNGCTRDDAQRCDFPAARRRALTALRRHRLVFALDVAAARLDGVTPLPFSGEPQWDTVAADVVGRARRFAAGRGQGPSTVDLLAGLLAARDGAFRAAFAASVGDPDAALARLAERPLPGAAAGGSHNYRAVLAGAAIGAKGEQAPTISERHLVASFLDVRSTALDGALAALATSRAALRAAVVRLVPDLPAPPSDASAASLPTRAG